MRILPVLLLLVACAEAPIRYLVDPSAAQQFYADTAFCEAQAQRTTSLYGDAFSYTNRRAYDNCMLGKGYVHVE
jgi:hypothetical protein